MECRKRWIRKICKIECSGNTIFVQKDRSKPQKEYILEIQISVIFPETEGLRSIQRPNIQDSGARISLREKVRCMYRITEFMKENFPNR